MHRFALIALTLAAFSSSAFAAIKTEIIEYQAGDTKLKGFLAYDDAAKEKRPGILVMPEWWGLTDYPKGRARQLAEQGYVAFAADMYGDGKTTDDPNEAGKWSGEVKENVLLRRSRETAALDVLKSRADVDPEKIGAIGFCFGGAMVLDMMRATLPVKGVVSFHGALGTDTPAGKESNIRTRALILHGDADTLVPPAEVAAFEKEMKDAEVQYELVKYPGAKHAFSNPGADKYNLPPVAYQKEAAEKSWKAMTEFFENLFETSEPPASAVK